MYSEIKKLIDREYLTIGIFSLFIFLSILLFRNFLVPSAAECRSVIDRHNYYKSIGDDRSKYEGVKDTLAGLKKKLISKNRQFEDMYQRPENISVSYQKLFDIAWDAGFKFDKIMPEEEVEKDGWIENVVLFNTETGFSNLGKFITGVENRPDSYSIEGIAGRVRKNGLMAVKIRIRCYTARDRVDN